MGGLGHGQARPDEALVVPLDLGGYPVATRNRADEAGNAAGVFVVLVSPVLLSASSTEVRQPLPFSRRTSVLRSTSMLGVSSIRQAR